MAYLDGRSEIGADPFPSSIGGNWANGEGDYQDLGWVASGDIASLVQGDYGGMRRTGESYPNDQYSTVIIKTQTHNSVAYIYAAVRMQGGTDESAYAGVAGYSNGGPSEYALYEWGDGLGVAETLLVSETAQIADFPLQEDEFITTEAVGTTLNLGGNGGGSDVLKATISPVTNLTSGSPGVVMWCDEYEGCRVKAWAGGEIVTDLPPVMTVPRELCTSSLPAESPTPILGLIVTQGTAPITSVGISATSGSFHFNTTGTSVTLTGNDTADVLLENGATPAEYNTVLGTCTYTGAPGVRGTIPVTAEVQDATLNDVNTALTFLNDVAAIRSVGTPTEVIDGAASLRGALAVGAIQDTLTFRATDDSALYDETTFDLFLLANPVLPRNSVMTGVAAGILQGVL